MDEIHEIQWDGFGLQLLALSVASYYQARRAYWKGFREGARKALEETRRPVPEIAKELAEIACAIHFNLAKNPSEN